MRENEGTALVTVSDQGAITRCYLSQLIWSQSSQEYHEL